MRASNPLTALQAALDHALTQALPAPGQPPLDPSQADVRLFPQLWPGTALGFGGITCHAMTWAHTAVISVPGRRCAAVYFNGRFAYRIHGDEIPPACAEAFWSDMLAEQMVSVREAAARYGAETELSAQPVA